MRRHTLIVLGIGWLAAAAGLVVAADPAHEEAIKRDREKCEGVWRVVALEMEGYRASEADTRGITVTNHVDGTWVLKFDDKEVARGTSKIDPTKRPKAIDLTPNPVDPTQIDPGIEGMTFRGIYEIDGDSPRVCYAAPGKGRPADFSSEPGSGHVLVVFRRETK